MPKFLTLISMLLTLTLAGGICTAATFTVDSLADDGDTSPGDGNCLVAAGDCTLRAAIEEANALAGADFIEFDLGAGHHTFTPATAYVIDGSDLLIDGFSAVGAVPNTAAAPLPFDPATNLTITIDGTNVNTTAAASILIEANNIIIRGLNVHSGPFHDIAIGATHWDLIRNRIQGCFVGTDVTGMIALPAGRSFQNPYYASVALLHGAQANTIGCNDSAACDPSQRNLLSGQNRVGFNYMGCGVLMHGSAAVGDVISQNLVHGNLIGTQAKTTIDASGEVLAALPNRMGLYLTYGTLQNRIWGNTISGNSWKGVHMTAGGATENAENSFLRNFIGLALLSDSPIVDQALPNGGDGFSLVMNCNRNLIGDGDFSNANVISGNDAMGLSITSPCTGNVIDGNIIGLDSSGAFAMPNGNHGVNLYGPGGNQIGTMGQGNVISGNGQTGIFLFQTDGQLVESNIIGLDITSTQSRPNATHAVTFFDSTNCNIKGNLIAQSNRNGIYCLNSDSSNTFEDNTIRDSFNSGIELSGCSPSILRNQILDNTNFGIKVGVSDSDPSYANPGNDVISRPQIGGEGDANYFEGNNFGAISSIDTQAVNASTLHLDNTFDASNLSQSIQQRWQVAVELVDSSGTPITTGAFEAVTSNGLDVSRTLAFPNGGLWGQFSSFSIDNRATWTNVLSSRFTSDGTLREASLFTITASGEGLAGQATFTFDGINDDTESGNGYPNWIETDGLYRYQIAEVVMLPDADGDGVSDDTDCAPSDPLYSDDTAPCDADSDGYCDANITGQVLSSACPSEGEETLEDPSDCDDDDGDIYPGATEICNEVDDNCDGDTDEGLQNTYYADADGDEFGDPDSTTLACDPPTGYVVNSDDCNDGDGNVNPEAAESCNQIDDNCDGDTDEGVLITFYADGDGDGFGAAGNTTEACSAPDGYADNTTDCDDENNAVHPDATEICNEVDDNCDGDTDEGVLITFYADTDGDGHGDSDATTEACTAPTGYSDSPTDCDDNNNAIHPDATEVCDNTADDDCNGAADDEDPVCFSCGNGIVQGDESCDDGGNEPDDGCNEGCQVEEGWACRNLESQASLCGSEALAGTVVITELMIDPACTEDADGEWIEIFNASDSDLNLGGWRISDDGTDDAFLPQISLPAAGRLLLCKNEGTACSLVLAFSLSNSDDEVILQDVLDSLVDEVWYDSASFPVESGASMQLDPDADAVGNDLGENWCASIQAIVEGCGDLGTPSLVNLGCDATCWDADEDGQMDEACGGTDCDDDNADISPSATEICDDNIDNDCDGDTDAADEDCTPVCPDADEDGFDDATCGGSDCDDNNAAINPDADEICNDSVDNDCDGNADEADTDCVAPCADADEDGHTDVTCGGDDCDDNDAAVNPEASEICDDGIDNDCDGDVDSDDTIDCPDDDNGPAESGCGCASSNQGANSALFLMGLALIWVLRRKEF